MSNKDRSTKNSADKRGNQQGKENREPTRVNVDENTNGEEYRSTDLRNSPMMAHLMDAMEAGQDIGEYGRLTFVMIARHFLSDDELIKLLVGQPGMEDETDARAMVLQVKERDYNPPKRERILQWMKRQEFPICPTPDDPNGCNVYRELQFPDNIYQNINEFWEEKAEAEE